MNKRIMLTLAIAASLLNSGFSVMAADSDTKPVVNLERLKDKVEGLRIAAEKAAARSDKAESQFNSRAKIIGYSKNLVIALLASAGVIAPLSQTVPHLYNFISATDINSIDIKKIGDIIAVGTIIQMAAAGLILGTVELSRSVYNYFQDKYWEINNEKYKALNRYERAKQKLAQAEELAKAA